MKRMLKYRFDTEKTFCIRYYRKECCSNAKLCIFNNELSEGCGILEEEVLSEYDLKQYYDTATIEGRYDGFVADVLLTSSSNKYREPVFLEDGVGEQRDSGGVNDPQAFYPFLRSIASAVRGKFVLVGPVQVMVHLLKELLRARSPSRPCISPPRNMLRAFPPASPRQRLWKPTPTLPSTTSPASE